MKGQKWLISCIKKYRKNIAISSGIAIFSDVSKRCNILLLQYIAIKNAQPWFEPKVSISSSSQIIQKGGTVQQICLPPSPSPQREPHYPAFLSRTTPHHPPLESTSQKRHKTASPTKIYLVHFSRIVHSNGTLQLIWNTRNWEVEKGGKEVSLQKN